MSEKSMRTAISSLNRDSTTAHVGLWLDRMLPEQLIKDSNERTPASGHPHTKLIRQAHTIAEPEEYKNIFTRWECMLTNLEACRQRKAEVRGRMVIGLGAEGVLETSITIHRTYGMPYIPGSALKGLAAAYAHQRLKDETWRKPPLVLTKDAPFTAHEILFGSTRSAGYVTFFDALYKPDSGHLDEKGTHRALWPDVITVHHPNYYQEKKSDQPEKKPDGQPVQTFDPPADWDSPTPISFVSATGTYLIALAGPDDWVTKAFDILALALDEMGVGGKTSSGYGRMTLDGLDEAKQRWDMVATDTSIDNSTNTVQVDPEIQLVAPLLNQIQSLPLSRVAMEIHTCYQQWKMPQYVRKYVNW